MKKKVEDVLRCGLALCLLCGCDLIGSTGLPDLTRAERDIIRRREGQEEQEEREDDPEQGPEVLWISGVEYPEGYDWQRDTAYGQVEARIVVLRDGVRTLEIPTGERQEVSTDPDMHRLIGGHLYTDYSSGSETVIRRDGQELFRFGGREMIVGFLVRGETVWTLGVNRATGKGPVLRRNGEPVFSDPDGLLPPGFGNKAFEGGLLHLDGEEMFFFYRSGQGWFRVRDRFAEPISLPSELSAVHDIRRIGGKTVIAGSTAGQPLVLSQDGVLRTCSASGAAVRNIALVPSGASSFFIKGEMVRSGGVTPTVWTQDGTVRVSASGNVLDFYLEEGYAAYLSSGADGIPTRYVKDGVGFAISGRNHFISRHCALLQDGIFYLLLTPTDRTASPFLLKDGVRQDIPVGGYLTGISLTR